mgnify:CR=1 FL=1
MEKEDNILRKVGTKNPFSVPDGYFEKFSEELISQLPEKETLYIPSEPTMWERVKPWVYMTAMFFGIMLSVRIFVGEPQKEEFPNIEKSPSYDLLVDAVIHNYKSKQLQAIDEATSVEG